MENLTQDSARKKTIPVRHSLKGRFLALLLGVTVMIVVAIGYLSVDALQRASQTAQQTSRAALRAQTEEYLLEITADNANQIDLTLEKTRSDAENVARYAASVFSQPEAFATQSYWSAEEYMAVGANGQFVNGPEDRSAVFVPNTVAVTDQLLTDLELAAYLDFNFVPVYEGDPNSVAIYFVGKEDVTRLYPNIELGNFLPADYQPTQDVFYLAGTPENNPSREPVWTSVYDDPAGQGLLISTIAPIYLENDEFFGIIGIDVSLNNLRAGIEAREMVAGAYSFLIDGQGRAIALPTQGYRDLLGRAPEPGEFGTDLNAASSDFDPILTDMKAGVTGFANVNANGKELFVAYAPLAGTGWSLATVIEAERVLEPIIPLQEKLAAEASALISTRLLPVGGMIFVVVLIFGLWLANRLVNPLQQLVMGAQGIGAGRWDTPLPPAGRDEVGLLSRELKTMTDQLHQAFGTLETQVASRTARLEVLATLSGRISAILNLEELLAEVVNQVKENFGYYHAHIYLVDDTREKLVVAAGTGQAGEQMKAKGHHISLNAPTSLVARAARSGQVVNIDNVRVAEDWLPNPLLPETYSEMAVPIVLEGQVVGVLDVQQDEVAGLDEGDANLLRSLANQVAVTIRNARLFAEVETALAEAHAAQERYIEQSWRKTALGADQRKCIYIDPEATPLDEAKQQALASSRQQFLTMSGPKVASLDDGEEDQTLVAPVHLRNKKIGTVQLYSSRSEQPWSEVDLQVLEAVLDELAQTAETLRLFDESRKQAGREQTIREITERLRTAPDLKRLVEIAAEELGERLAATHAKLNLGVQIDPANRGNGN